MSIAAGIRKALGVKSQGPPPTLTLASAKGWPTADQDETGISRGLNVAVANRCIEVLSNSMAVLPTFLVRERDHKRLTKHPLLPILHTRANESMSAYDLTRALMGSQISTGNAYAWTHRDPNTGAVLERILLDPACVTPMVMPDGKLWYWYADPQSGDLIQIPQEDVTHYKAFSQDGITGISVMARAALTLETAYAAQRYERGTWTNGGRPSGVLQCDTDLSGFEQVPQPDGTTKDIPIKDLIRREWDRIHRGPDNAWRIAVLDHGLKYTPIAMSPADTQFVESAEVRALDICRFFGVPPHLAFAGKQSYESNEQNGIEYVNYTLLGYETGWRQEDTWKLLHPRERAEGINVRRELKVYLRGNVEAQAKWLETMVDVGAYDVDEVRALDDRPPVPGGKSRRASLNYIPLEHFEELSRLRAEHRNGGD